MITVNDSNLLDLKTELNLKETWNEQRVILPGYTYTLEWNEEQHAFIRIPDDYSQRAIDGPSTMKYGRRTKTTNKHVIDRRFGEAFCTGEVARWKEPRTKLELKLAGMDDDNIAMVLAAKISDRVAYSSVTVDGLSGVAVVDSLNLSIDLDGMPRLTLRITQGRAEELVDVFHIGVDEIDGNHVTG